MKRIFTFNEIVDMDKKAMSFDDIRKFNPYHGHDGRFTTSGGAASFTYAPGKSKAHENAIAREKLRTAAAGGAGSKVDYDETDTKTFTDAVKTAKATVDEKSRWRVTAYDQDEFNEYHSTGKCYVTKGGSTFAVDNGDIISVCASKKDNIRGKQLIEAAVEKGGKKLDSYDGNDAFYKKCGFEPVSWCKWDDQWAPSDWITANGYTQQQWESMVNSGNTPKNSELKVRREDIVFYKFTGNKSTQTLKEFKSQVPASEDYDVAMKTRDDSM